MTPWALDVLELPAGRGRRQREQARPPCSVCQLGLDSGEAVAPRASRPRTVRVPRPASALPPSKPAAPPPCAPGGPFPPEGPQAVAAWRLSPRAVQGLSVADLWVTGSWLAACDRLILINPINNQ